MGCCHRWLFMFIISVTNGHHLIPWGPEYNRKVEERSICFQFELRHPLLSSGFGAFSPGAFRLRTGLTPPSSPTHTLTRGPSDWGWATRQAFQVLQLGHGRWWNFLASINSMRQVLGLIQGRACAGSNQSMCFSYISISFCLSFSLPIALKITGK